MLPRISLHGARLIMPLRGSTLAPLSAVMVLPTRSQRSGRSVPGSSCQAKVSLIHTPSLLREIHTAPAPQDPSNQSQPSSPLVASWVDRVPAPIQPYLHLMRMDKPVGSWLLFWPGAWGIAMACHPAIPDPKMIGLFALGAVVMRGAGCTINDLWDRDIDKRVERTKTRPLAAGKITFEQALVFLGGQLTVGLGVLVNLNTYSILLGASSLSLVVTYPLMKRITYWPQFVLGMAFNWGALLGWSAITGDLNLAVTLPLYAAGILWTLNYDTIYAHQDKKDDKVVGVKSTALLFGNQTKSWLTAFSVAQYALLNLSGYYNNLSLPFYVATTVGLLHQAWQLKTVDLNNGTDCMKKFVSNKWYGGIIFSGIATSGLLGTSAFLTGLSAHLSSTPLL